MKRNYLLMALSFLVSIPQRIQTSTPQVLPLTQNWTVITMITTDDDWSGVPGIVGYRGDNITASTGVDPQTLIGEGTITVDVIANQTNPNTQATGGVAEFHISNPVVALQGSGTADAPNLVFYLNTTSLQNIDVAYNLLDIDGSTDDATQPVALQYRVGNTGNFTNVPAGFVADATTGPSLATLVTAVNATLPAACNDQPEVQVRVITSNATGNDEWVGIDDIVISGQALVVTPVNLVGFSGYRQANKNYLNWTTSSENNNAGFDIQCSLDGVNYTSVGFVNTLATGGNSATNLNYYFTDNNASGNKQFYRLCQVDNDNRSRFSNVVLIKGEKPFTLAIDGLFPNPASTVVNVLVAAPGRNKIALVIINIAGRTVMQQLAEVGTGSNTIPVNISHLGSGTYTVKLVCGNNCDMAVSKFVKQ